MYGLKIKIQLTQKNVIRFGYLNDRKRTIYASMNGHSMSTYSL